MKPAIKTNLAKEYAKFSVDESVTNWLKESTEIIFDIIQNAVQNNRFEIVDSGLNNIVDIATEYTEVRKNYATEQDAFLTFIHEKLIDTKNLVGKNSHPKIILSIARAAKDISIAALEVTPIRSFAGENFLPYGFIALIADICLSPEIVKETSYAPMTTIDYLVDIANKAIDKNFPKTAIVVTDRLGQIAINTTKLHFLFADIVAGKANWGLAAVLDYLLSNQDKITLSAKYEIGSILEKIDQSITTYLEDDIKYHYSTRSNIRPLFGLMSTREHGIAAIFIRTFQKRYNERTLWLVIESLERFLGDINQNIMKGMNNSKYSDVKEILEHLYMIGIVLIPLINNKKTNPGLQQKIITLLEKSFFYPFTNAIQMSFKRDQNRYTIFYDDYMHTFFSLIGILFYENKDTLYKSVLETWITKVVEIIQKYKTKTMIQHADQTFPCYEIIHPLSDLYSYLRLVGTWTNKFLPKSNVLSKIVTEIKIQPQTTIKTSSYGQDNLYPKYMLQSWIVQRPSIMFYPKYFSDIDQTLVNDKLIQTFEKKLKGKNEKNVQF